MDQPHRINKLLEIYGQTFSNEVGIRLEQDSPSAYFQLLLASVLFSARISHRLSINAMKELIQKGYTTPKNVQQSSWEERARVLNESGYARFDEKTSAYMGEIADLVMNKYQGDLRKMREQSERNPARIRKALKEFKGMGKVGSDIFLREVQGQWKEFYPFADKKSLQVAEKLNLPTDANKLAELIPEEDFPRLIAALLRVDLKRDYALRGEEHDKENEHDLKNKTKEKLYKLARKQNISGRSRMNKEELLEALSQ